MIPDPYAMKCGMFTKYGAFDPLYPDPDLVDIEDIAYALSNTTRFNGHIPISVAQHSVMVYERCKCIQALMHDSAEAYLGDHISPQKRITYYLRGEEFVKVSTVEEELLEVIFAKFEIPWEWSNTWVADKEQCEYEIANRDTMRIWSAGDSYAEFMSVFNRENDKRNVTERSKTQVADLGHVQEESCS